MAREFNRLNKRAAYAIVRAGKPGWYPDGLGLYLVVAEGGSASWTVMYRKKPARRNMGLGPYRLVSLEKARKKRDEAHSLLLEGKDPLAHRAVRHRKQATALTFREAAKAYIDATQAERRNPKSLAQWHMTLLGQTPEGERTEFNYCALLHDLPVGSIDTDAVLSVLKPVWESKPESASRIRGRIEKVIDYAVVHGRAGEVGPDHRNPAAWKGRLEHLLPAKGKVHEVRHHAALDYESVPEFMAKLKIREGLAARALELAILTAVRTGDLIGSDREERPPMKWEHVERAERMWLIPRTKMNVPHRVPLSRQAVELLEAVRRDYPNDGSGIVFVGDKRGQPMSNGAMLRVRDRMIADGLIPAGAMTTHGARASFKSWASDQTSFDREVIEAALTHVISDKLEAAYRRSDFYAKRARLMQAWADFCDGAPMGNVVSLRG